MQCFEEKGKNEALNLDLVNATVTWSLPHLYIVKESEDLEVGFFFFAFQFFSIDFFKSL